MDKIIILGHENTDVDAISSGYLLEKLLKQKSTEAEFIIPDKTIDKETLDICIKYRLDPNKYQKQLPLSFSNYILVDHNNRKVNGEIVCVIYHHPSIDDINIKHYYNRSISSTTCYICKGNEKYFSDDDLKLVFVGTMVDTASFHSTKSR